MVSENSKYAFFSIDVERFTDTECVRNSNQKIRKTMLDGLDRYIKILDKYNIKATLFVLSDVADELYGQLKKHIDNGHKIALHGKKHVSPSLLTDEQFREQTLSAKRKLEEKFNVKIEGYRAPCFGLNREKLDAIKEFGFSYDSSRLDFGLARHNSYIDIDDYEKIAGEIYRKDDFFEFGVVTHKFFGKKFPISGGGYLRLPSWLFASTLLEQYIRRNNYYVFYSHPFEFSKERIPFIKNLKLYDRLYLAMGLLTYPYKIEFIIKRLIKAGFEFRTFEDTVDEFKKKEM